MKYTIGCDPELFAYNSKSKRFLSAHPWIKGTKEKPSPVNDGATQLDGVSAEFNIFPCRTAEQFTSRIQSVIFDMEKQVYNPDIELVATPVAWFDQEYFALLPEKVRELGCMPDYNAYTKDVNDPPVTDKPFRTGSGHIHVGYNTSKSVLKKAYKEDVMERVKQLDYTLYPLSLLWDDSQERRELYGAPGAFRYKPYGFEYRVLSNAWVSDNNLHKWVFEATVRAMELYDEGEDLFDDEPPIFHSEVTKGDLVEYHDQLVSQYQFPPLPASVNAA